MTSTSNAVTSAPVALSWSGGKDATMSLHTLEEQGRPVAALLSTFGADGRSSGHGVRRELVEAQADALGVPLATVQFPDPCPNDVYEASIAAALERPPLVGLGEMAFGDLFLEDHRDYRTQQLAKAGWTASFPIWRLDTDALFQELVPRYLFSARRMRSATSSSISAYTAAEKPWRTTIRGTPSIEMTACSSLSSNQKRGVASAVLAGRSCRAWRNRSSARSASTLPTSP